MQYVAVSALSHDGLVRDHNEDSLVIGPWTLCAATTLTPQTFYLPIGAPVVVVVGAVVAVVVAWLPGTEAAGITDVLFGDVHPTGRLPHSWPRNMAQIPINQGDATYDPLFPYAFGLTY